MCAYLYIHNKYTQYKTFILDVINCLTALHFFFFTQKTRLNILNHFTCREITGCFEIPI